VYEKVKYSESSLELDLVFCVFDFGFIYYSGLNMIYFTADTHFNHENIIRYCGRPFKSKDDMNLEMIRRWNEVVLPGDVVFHLGDFGFGNCEDIINQLNGKIYFIPGSHDSHLLRADYFIKSVKILPLYYNLKHEKQHVVLSHYCMRTWPQSYYGSWHLFGHSHGKLEPIGKSLDVGVDVHDFYPLSWLDIKSKMKRRPHNFDFVGSYYDEY